jgi:hypothetical protein
MMVKFPFLVGICYWNVLELLSCRLVILVSGSPKSKYIYIHIYTSFSIVFCLLLLVKDHVFKKDKFAVIRTSTSGRSSLPFWCLLA